MAKYDANDPEAIQARQRVQTIIDAVPPDLLVASIKRTPSLRGMILGYVAELMFERHLPETYSSISPEDISSHDDHDRSLNKSDRTIKFGDVSFGIQLKSIQTNSIRRNLTTGLLQAVVQNDASDARQVVLPNGHTLTTTCYVKGDYDILAVPLFPFNGEWNFAYKYNSQCRTTSSRKYSPEDAQYLLATTEIITWPVGQDWTMNLMELLV